MWRHFPLQHFNNLTPEGRKRSLRRRARSRRLVKNGVKVIEVQLNQAVTKAEKLPKMEKWSKNEWLLRNAAGKFDTIQDL